jgi:hypothetical protein
VRTDDYGFDQRRRNGDFPPPFCRNAPARLRASSACALFLTF